MVHVTDTNLDTNLDMNLDTKIPAGMFVLLTFAGLRIDSRLRSLT